MRSNLIPSASAERVAPVPRSMRGVGSLLTGRFDLNASSACFTFKEGLDNPTPLFCLFFIFWCCLHCRFELLIVYQSFSLRVFADVLYPLRRSHGVDVPLLLSSGDDVE